MKPDQPSDATLKLAQAIRPHALRVVQQARASHVDGALSTAQLQQAISEIKSGGRSPECGDILRS